MQWWDDSIRPCETAKVNVPVVERAMRGFIDCACLVTNYHNEPLSCIDLIT